ncbi:recombinase RecT [Kitasatospora sp. NPDC051164]|uniref:recombinase RecT n=1 Tax=Kitasatospora sp. NPDC051164 TaxID=3364055 RepID=UPI0037B2AA79
MTETIASALERRDNGPSALVEQYRGDFTMVLPSHIKPETWVRLAQGVLRRDRNLQQVAARNPGSFMAALLECARLGHEPGTPSFYLVPFGSEVQGIEGYRGKIDRIYRAGAVASITAEVVYERDEYHFKPGPNSVPDHTPWDGEDPGPLVRVYAYAQMKDGSLSRVVRLNRSQVERHMRESRGWDKPSSPWKRWPESMWLKTALHELEKWVPSSTERQTVEVTAAPETSRRSVPAEPYDEGPIDGEIVEDES